MSHGTHKWVMPHILQWAKSKWDKGYRRKGLGWKYTTSHMNHSCHTYEWGMPHVRMSHVIMGYSLEKEVLALEMGHVTYEWVTSHVWMSHVTHMNESCFKGYRLEKEALELKISHVTYEWVMSHVWRGHITHTNESYHTYEWVMSYCDTG